LLYNHDFSFDLHHVISARWWKGIGYFYGTDQGEVFWG